jgi:cation diffusion facilitator family transporter
MSNNHHHENDVHEHHGHHHGHEHAHGHDGKHGHTHGVVDPAIATTERGIWAIKWSFLGLFITAVLQVVVVWYSGSVALLADTIHNFGDAATALPLWIAFLFARLKPNRRFTYGYGKVEDLAGAVIVGIILFSALVAGYESIDRLMHPRPLEYLWAVVAASIIGFAGNEIVAVFRIKVGKEINSVALIADGYHARVDGWTSLAVLFGALGVWLGFPLADPIVGLGITIAIFGIVWQSARAVFTRMLDGVDPAVVEEIEHAALHVGGVKKVEDIRARWLGHKLRAELTVSVSPTATVDEVDHMREEIIDELHEHLPYLSGATIQMTAQ